MFSDYAELAHNFCCGPSRPCNNVITAEIIKYFRDEISHVLKGYKLLKEFLSTSWNELSLETAKRNFEDIGSADEYVEREIMYFQVVEQHNEVR